MAIENIDPDLITSDEYMNTLLGGQAYGNDALVELAPAHWDGSTKPARKFALDRVLQYLRGKNPPIRYSDLINPEELALVVYYGAAEHLYQLALSTAQGGDVFEHQRQLWATKFEDALSGLTLTLPDGETVSGAHGFTVGRR